MGMDIRPCPGRFPAAARKLMDERRLAGGTSAHATHVPARARRMARRRSLTVLAIFATATLVAFFAPRLAFASICGALLLHLRPEAFGSRP